MKKAQVNYTDCLVTTAVSSDNLPEWSEGDCVKLLGQTVILKYLGERFGFYSGDCDTVVD